MPVQRIARYPLLLQTIQKHTDPQHPAYSLLEHTAHTTVQLNCRINEYKRFREVGKDLTSILDNIYSINTVSLCQHGQLLVLSIMKVYYIPRLCIPFPLH